MGIHKAKQRKNIIIQVRVDDDEMAKIEALKDSFGYPTTSSYLRDIIFKKKISVLKYENKRNKEDILRKGINKFIYQMNKIGSNYNQIVTLYEKQVMQVNSDGTPAYNERNFIDKLSRMKDLMALMNDQIVLLTEHVSRNLNNDKQ